MRGLYAAVFDAERPPLVEPIEAEGAGQLAEEHPEAEIPENLDPEPEVADSTISTQFQLDRISGRFGLGQYRRVRVQEP